MKLLTLLSVILPAIFAEYTFETRYIEVPLDHYSFTTDYKFKLKYLVNDTYFDENGAIFFYAGNEGDINMFAQNSGLIFDIAPEFKALIIFAEHRYYGESLPFGNLSYSSPEYLGYLSATQAMADFVYLINNLQETYAESSDLEKLPVIAFGGSYGGMLATWLKMKFPNTILGAIASSAPIWQFKDQNPCNTFYQIITDDFQNIGSEKCKNTIRDSWAIIRSYTSTPLGKSELADLWNFCSPFKTDNDIEKLIGWLTEVYAALAETNYPYPTNFLVPLPGNPIKEFCNIIDDNEFDTDIGLLKALRKALQIYTNYTETTTCNQLDSTSAVLGETGWNFQSCTEMIMPICSTDDDMFENAEWDFEAYSDHCYEQFGVRPLNEEVPLLQYGNKDLSTAINIIFSNGLLDPWSGYGVLNNLTTKFIAVVIPDGAHHSELRASNEEDPPSLTTARAIEINAIYNWINEYRAKNMKKKLEKVLSSYK